MLKEIQLMNKLKHPHILRSVPVMYLGILVNFYFFITYGTIPVCTLHSVTCPIRCVINNQKPFCFLQLIDVIIKIRVADPK
jgi:hypothetical protein